MLKFLSDEIHRKIIFHIEVYDDFVGHNVSREFNIVQNICLNEEGNIIYSNTKILQPFFKYNEENGKNELWYEEIKDEIILALLKDKINNLF